MAISVGSGKLPGASVLDAPGKILGEIGNFLQNPFSVDVPNTNPKPDFPNGFVIDEIFNGRILDRERIRLVGSWIPKQPFNFGGLQRISKEFYAGNSEPVVQVLGPEEKDLVINGTINAKNIKLGPEFRTVATEVQQQLDGMRIRGNLLQLTMGEFRRFGFLIDTDFNMRTLADLDYQLTFSIIGFNPPLNCNQIDTERAVPFEINKDLIAAAADFQSTYSAVPDTIPQSLGDLINGAISDVMGAVNAVTGFIDDTLSTVEDITGSINRALGVVRFAKAEMSRFRRRLGAIGFTDITGNTTTIASYNGFSFASEAVGATWDLSSFLAQLEERFAALQETVPLARHRIVAGDTLQKIAVQFYNDSGEWEAIYDHNNLTSTELTEGDVLEIPQV